MTNSTLSDEIKEWVYMFVQMDLDSLGHISDDTREIARVQNVDISHFETKLSN